MKIKTNLKAGHASTHGRASIISPRDPQSGLPTG